MEQRSDEQTTTAAPILRLVRVRRAPHDMPKVDDERLVAPSRTRGAGFYERFAKPVFDRCVATVLLLLLSPVLLATTIALWLTLGSPILFRQTRMGRGSKPFDMYKFRTMHADRRRQRQRIHGPERRKAHKTPDDPRHTRIGRFLRQTSIDELPQLLNVLRGEMSLVGPRPELMDIVERYEQWQHGRHHVKPGMTGLWQVSERGNGLMHEHVHIDLEYVDRISVVTDCKVLVRTIPALLKRDTS